MTSGKWILIGVVGLVVTVIGSIQLLHRPWVVKPMSGNSSREVGMPDSKCGRLVISRYGLPGESQTCWTITSDGEVKRERLSSSGTSSITVNRLEQSSVKRLQEIVPKIRLVARIYTGSIAVHDNLAMVVTCDDGVSHEAVLKNGARPKEVVDLLNALDSILGEHLAIRY